MATGIGLRTVVGTGVETTYGTAVAVTRRLEFVSESMQRNNQILQSDGISGRAQTVRHGGRRVLSATDGTGDLVMEVGPKGYGRWFQLMLGGAPVITTPGGATTARLHTYTLGSLTGNSLTLEKAIRDGGGTVVEAFRYTGCKATQWGLSISNAQIAQLSVSLDAQQVVDAGTAATLVGLAEPDPLARPFTFMGASLTLDGAAAVRVLNAEITGDNSLKVDSYFLGSSGLKADPEVNGWRTVNGTMTAEHTDTSYGGFSLHDLFVADEGVALVLKFVGEVIETTFNEELTVTIPDIRLTGETPQVGGPDVVSQTINFEGQYDGTNPPVTLTYQTTDTVA